MKTERITLNVDPEFAARIRRAANLDDRTVSAWGARALLRAIEESESTAAPLYLTTPAPPRLNVAENLAAVAGLTPPASGKATTKPTRYKLTK